MSWTVTVDQRASSGGTQRFSSVFDVKHLHEAVDAALFQFNLHRAEVGSYQITCTPEALEDRIAKAAVKGYRNVGSSSGRWGSDISSEDDIVECKHGVPENGPNARICMDCEAE